MHSTERIQEYLLARWEWLGRQGWQGEIKRSDYLARNSRAVRRNLRDNPHYIDDRIKLFSIGHVIEQQENNS